MEGDAARLGRREVVGGGVDGQRRDAGLGGERRQPAGDPLALLRPRDHVEDHDHRLPGRRGGAEEIAHGGVVVLLLREHGDEHVAGVANQLRPLPVFAQRAVDVGRVEEHEPGRLAAAGILAPHEPVGIIRREGVGPAGPGHGREAGKQRREVDPAGEAAGQAGNRMPRPRRLRHRSAHLRADEGVGDQALAGVGAAADRGDEHGLPRHLGPQLAEQGTVPLGPLGLRRPDGPGRRLEGLDEGRQFGDFIRPRGIRPTGSDRRRLLVHQPSPRVRGLPPPAPLPTLLWWESGPRPEASVCPPREGIANPPTPACSDARTKTRFSRCDRDEPPGGLADRLQRVPRL